MQKINLDLIHIRVTNSEGYEIYINDIDNLKYRVIRAAHSVRNFSRPFKTFHWHDRDQPIQVRILQYDLKDFVTFNREHPPCVRSLMIQSEAEGKNIRDFEMNEGDCSAYASRILLATNKLKTDDADIVSVHDDLDDAKLYLNETSDEIAAYKKLFLNTYRSKLGVDYHYAVLIAKLFKNYIHLNASKEIDALLVDTYTLIQSDDILNKEFRAQIPKISEKVKAIVEKNLLETHFDELAASYPNHPAILKAAKKEALFDKLFDALLALDKNKAPKKEKKVTFYVQILATRLSRVKAVIDFCKQHVDETSRKHLESLRLFQPDAQLKESDEAEIESYVRAIETNADLNLLIHRYFKSLEAKSANIRLHQALIERVNKAKRAKDLFRAAYLTMDLKVLIEKWNECNASPTKVPAIQV